MNQGRMQLELSRLLSGPMLVDPATAERLIALRGASTLDDLGAKRETPSGDPVQAGGVAVVPVHGILTKRPSIFTLLGFGTATDEVRAQLRALEADEAVRSIVLDVDSPGGDHHGPFELAEVVRNLQTPTIGVANEIANSGGYLVLSACGEIVAVQSAQLGSIGVAATHVDMTGADEEMGLNYTIFRAGRFKQKPNAHEPLDQEGIEAASSFTASVMELFIQHVRAGRGDKLPGEIDQWANGLIWLAPQAVELGLADRIGTLDGVLRELDQREQETEPFGMVRPRVLVNVNP